MNEEREWIKVSRKLPPQGVVVETKIHDAKGERNIQPLKREGRLWFFPDGSMYTFYTPTHWRTGEEVGMTISVIIKLWVLHSDSEGKNTSWKAENWRGTMPDEGEYDPLVLSREGGLEPDSYQLFKLEEIVLVDDQCTAVYERVPVTRAGRFYKALPKWRFEKMKEPAFLKKPIERKGK